MSTSPTPLATLAIPAAPDAFPRLQPAGLPAAPEGGNTAQTTRPGPFGALLLALAPSSPGPATAPVVASTDAPRAAVPAGDPAVETAPGSLATAAPGRPAGETLPEDGSELPPPALEDVLAALSVTETNSPDAAASAAALPAVAPSRPQEPAMGLPLPGPGPDGQDAGTAGMAGARPPPSGPTQSPRIDDRTEPPAIEASLPEADTNGGTSAPEVASRDESVAREPATDFRVRLESMIPTALRAAAPSNDITVSGATFAVPAPASATTPAGSVPTSGLALPADELPTLQPLADREAWSQGLGDRLLLMAERGLQTATLRLQPEHLGPVEIRIRVDDDGAAQVLFSAHHPQARDALEGALPRLRELFAEQGLNLAQANVDSGRGSFAERDAGRAWWRDGLGPEPATSPPPVTVAAWRLAPAASRRLDVWA